MSDWVLAIDFGTTNTVASVADAAGVRTLNVDGRPVMPSAVFLERVDRPGSPESWTVGERAVHLARRRLEQFEANPKRCVGDGTVFLGGRNVPVGDAIAALLTPIVQEAASQFARLAPAAVIVTHPASWAEDRVEVLRAAVRAAAHGRRWPEPTTLAEPVAAAQRTLGVAEIPEQARLVVLDFGGGTVDVSVVDRHGPTVTVVGLPTGIDSLGGEDFDLRLAEWMCAEVGHPGMFRRLTESPDPDARERAVELRTHARTVKEELSKRTVVHGQVLRSPPELPDSAPVQVSRDQLERLINGGRGHPAGLTEAVDLVDQALRHAPKGPRFGGVFLVGGSSRINRLGVLVTAKTGRPPITQGDPTTAVSDGAAQYGWRQLQQPPAPPRGSGPPPPVSAAVPPPPAEKAVAGPAPRGRRRSTVVLVVLGVLLGGVGAAYAANQSGSDYQSSSSSYTCSDGTLVSYSYQCPSVVVTTEPTSTRRPTTTPTRATVVGLSTCSGTASGGCASTVLANSRRVWPAMSAAGSDCDVYDSYYESGVDRYTASCTAGKRNYVVIWRSSSVDFPAVADMYASFVGQSTSTFSLTGSSSVLGRQVRGAGTTNTGQDAYICAWEYERYPVAMVIEGPDDGTTPGACSDARFVTSSTMAQLFD